MAICFSRYGASPKPRVRRHVTREAALSLSLWLPPDSKAIATPEPRQVHSGHMLGLGLLYTRLVLTSLEARPDYKALQFFSR